MNLLQREFIYNCATDTAARELMLVRTKLIQTPFGNLDLHVFHASDAGRELHDHPWTFISLILWGGYTEVMPVRSIRRMILDNGAMSGWGAPESVHERARRCPGALLFRPANWAHRVELEPGRKSVSILWTFPKRTDRDWGFAPDGWVNWRTYHDRKGCF